MALYREPDYGFESDGDDSYDYNDDGPVDVWGDDYFPDELEWYNDDCPEDCSADDRNLAVMMALHSRLGADSPLAELGHLLVDLAHLWMA